jgi:hypothetical protein
MIIRIIHGEVDLVLEEIWILKHHIPATPSNNYRGGDILILQPEEGDAK